MKLNWSKIETLQSKNYTCGHCNNQIASEKAYYAVDPQRSTIVCFIYICHHCSKPTFFDVTSGMQIPGASFGNDVNDIDDKGVEALYNEARRCYSANAFTSVVLSCRKLLMHISVSKGAEEGLKFIQYVEYLAASNYIPPDAREWVDQIRSKGNEATHEIVIMKREDAEDLLTFVEMLLRILYEFPANIKRKTKPI